MSEAVRVAMVALLISCTTTAVSPDAAAPDAPGPSARLPDTERLPPPVPNAPRYHLPAPFALTLEPGQATAIDDCIACQHDMFGIRCSRRVTCPAPDCVLHDGTRLSPGAEADVELCLHCRCEPTGAVCERRTDGACPEGCAHLASDSGTYEVVPLGEQRAMSETAMCTCDATEGFTDCRTIFTSCDDGTPEGERVPHPSGCGSCLCSNGYLACDRRGCD
ncbi:MAG: hypothetical protein H0T79_17825 [Deltaproteobacteria bacterium]|nr:hypothetical protein [Deltaproteobacteria bacterium]